MVIKTSNLSRLNRWEAFQMLADALAYADALVSGEPPPAEEEAAPKTNENYASSLEAFRTAFGAYDDALVTERTLTAEELTAAEEGRDYDVRKLYGLLEELADYRHNPEIETAAKKAIAVFRPYGSGRSIARLRQDEETAVLTNLLQDLREEAVTQQIDHLQMTDLVESLTANNLVFEKEQQQRRDDRSQYPLGVVKRTREHAENAYRAFCQTVTALIILGGEERHTRLAEQLNQVNDDYVSKAQQRLGKTDDSDASSD